MFHAPNTIGRTEAALEAYALSAQLLPPGQAKPVVTTLDILLETAQQYLADVYTEYSERPRGVILLFTATATATSILTFALSLTVGR